MLEIISRVQNFNQKIKLFDDGILSDYFLKYHQLLVFMHINFLLQVSRVCGSSRLQR